MNIQIEKCSRSRVQETDFDNLAFGNIFSDHMLVCNYENGTWQQPHIKPYGTIEYQPAMSILHYGQGVFEGLKAFTYTDSKVNIFRLYSHYTRFNRSCKRLFIPEIPEEIFIDGVKKLIEIDRAWVPSDKYKSLYIRPFVFATDQYLGLKASANYSFIIITSPVGNYYKEGIKPIKLTTMPEYVRAVRGGVGNAKVPGNYAASLLPTVLAQKDGYAQVLWLDALEQTYIEEVGTSNIFTVINDEIVTPPLSGTILEGITRDSVIKLAKESGITVHERKITIEELFKRQEAGELSEVFASGTAAVVSPVGSIHHKGNTLELNMSEMGSVTSMLYNKITTIHHGLDNDQFNWCTII